MLGNVNACAKSGNRSQTSHPLSRNSHPLLQSSPPLPRYSHPPTDFTCLHSVPRRGFPIKTNRSLEGRIKHNCQAMLSPSGRVEGGAAWREYSCARKPKYSGPDLASSSRVAHAGRSSCGRQFAVGTSLVATLLCGPRRSVLHLRCAPSGTRLGQSKLSTQ